MTDRYTLTRQAVKDLREMKRRVGAGSTSEQSTPPDTGSLPRNVARKILIIATINAATWNNTTNKLTPVEFTAKLLFQHVDDDETYTYNTVSGEDEVDAVSFFMTEVTIGTGNARFGYIQNGELLIADCTEIDIS